MRRSKYFFMKHVYNSRGKHLGIVEDILIDFFKGEVLGFKISGGGIFFKNNFVSREDIASLEEDIICVKNKKYKGLVFKNIKGMSVINLKGTNIGAVEDIIIEEWRVLGVIVTTGIVEKFLKGKKVILTEDLILGEEKLITTANENIEMKMLRHGLGEIK